MKSNRAGLGCANPNKVPKDKNSFLTDEAKLALSKYQSDYVKYDGIPENYHPDSEALFGI